MSEFVLDLNPQFSTEELYAAWQQIAQQAEWMRQSTPVQGAEMLTRALAGAFTEVAEDVESAWRDYQAGRITETEVRLRINAGLQAISD